MGDVEEVSSYDASADLQKELSGGQKFMKGVLISINVLFLIFGIVLCSVGAAAMNNAVAGISGQTLPRGIIAIGSFILILSLVGFLSAWREWRFGLGIYFVFVLIFALILIAIGIAIYVKKDDASIYMSQGWQSASNDVKVGLQGAFSCCGLSDWNDSWAGVPCPSGLAIPDINHQKDNGCLNLMTSQFKSSFNSAGACGIAFAILMILSLFFIAFLMKGIKTTRYARQIEINREKTENEKQARRQRGEGLKLPDNVL